MHIKIKGYRRKAHKHVKKFIRIDKLPKEEGRNNSHCGEEVNLLKGKRKRKVKGKRKHK